MYGKKKQKFFLNFSYYSIWIYINSHSVPSLLGEFIAYLENMPTLLWSIVFDIMFHLKMTLWWLLIITEIRVGSSSRRVKIEVKTCEYPGLPCSDLGGTALIEVVHSCWKKINSIDKILIIYFNIIFLCLVNLVYREKLR